jgi:hypothetical protein
MTAMPTTNFRGECLCGRCVDEALKQYEPSARFAIHNRYYFRYACDVCGNKRCPHHEWHGFKCTGSNKPGQIGETA